MSPARSRPRGEPGAGPPSRGKRAIDERRDRGIQIVLLYLPVHLLVAVLTWRDISRPPAHAQRGDKRLWRLASAVNTLGAAGYWLVGRRAAERRRHSRR